MATLSPTRQAALDLVTDGKIIRFTRPGMADGVWLWTDSKTRGPLPSSTALNWLIRNGHITLAEADTRGRALAHPVAP
jgi:hypothetical protein